MASLRGLQKDYNRLVGKEVKFILGFKEVKKSVALKMGL